MADFEKPMSRNEAIVQNMLGAQNELGEPQSRMEALLMQLLEQGGGGKTLYNHFVVIESYTEDTESYIRANIVTSTSSSLGTLSALKDYVETVGGVAVSGYDNVQNKTLIDLSIGDEVLVASYGGDYVIIADDATINDVVTEI